MRIPLINFRSLFVLAVPCALACGGAASTEVHAASKPVVRAASLCHDRPTIEAPPSRVVAGYPLAAAVLSTDEASMRAAAAQTADWPQLRLDRFGFLETAGSRKGYRTPGYPEGPTENGERPEDVVLVQKLVDAHPAFFGPDPSDRVVGHGRIGTEFVVRYWGNGVISMQSIHTAHFVAMLAAGRAVPAARDVRDLLAPWVGAEIVKTPLPAPQMPCDPVTPSGRECERSEPDIPPSSLTKFDASALPATTMLRGEPPVLRSIVEVVLERDQQPCRKLPHFVDAITGEVLEWTAPIR